VVPILIFVAVLLLISQFSPSKEPRWQGKPLTEWLDELKQSSGEDTHRQVAEALRQMGTNSLPLLLDMLHTKDSWLKRKVMVFNRKQSIFQIPVEPAEQRRGLAVEALTMLGPTGKPAIPALGEALNGNEPFIPAAYALAQIGPEAVAPLAIAVTNQDRQVRIHGIAAMGLLGSNGQAAVPFLLMRLNDSDKTVRTFAARSLGQIGDGASNAIPILISNLSDPLASVRLASIRVLGSFSEKAKAAVPALLKAYATENSTLSREAAAALKKIDPEAAAVAGVTDETLTPSRRRR
jgi:HEAT repeat protein